jgi:hypothetical protein
MALSTPTGQSRCSEAVVQICGSSRSPLPKFHQVRNTACGSHNRYLSLCLDLDIALGMLVPQPWHESLGRRRVKDRLASINTKPHIPHAASGWPAVRVRSPRGAGHAGVEPVCVLAAMAARRTSRGAILSRRRLVRLRILGLIHINIGGMWTGYIRMIGQSDDPFPILGGRHGRTTFVAAISGAALRGR